MSGATGVMTVILLETAVGALGVLWLSGVWGKVRRGYFLLAGVTVALCALGAWALLQAAPESAAAISSAAALDRARGSATVFTVLAVAWQVLLLIRQEAVARVTGVLAAVAGVVTLVAVGLLSPGSPARAIAELVLGAVFLGSTLHGLLLGHWYLVERRLPNRYMVISAWWYIGGVLAAVGAVVLSAQGEPASSAGVSPLLAIPGFSTLLAGGLVAICGLIAAFVWKLAGEGGRSIQAATGMFYLAVIMAFSAELSAKVGFF